MNKYLIEELNKTLKLKRVDTQIQEIETKENKKRYARNWYAKNKDKMQKYHREYMKRRRSKEREDKLVEQRKTPTE
jgi:hypothetical protein